MVDGGLRGGGKHRDDLHSSHLSFISVVPRHARFPEKVAWFHSTAASACITASGYGYVDTETNETTKAPNHAISAFSFIFHENSGFVADN
jgi:hypothetical protein